MDDVVNHIDDHEDDIDAAVETKSTIKDKNGKYGNNISHKSFLH